MNTTNNDLDDLKQRLSEILFQYNDELEPGCSYGSGCGCHSENENEMEPCDCDCSDEKCECKN